MLCILSRVPNEEVELEKAFGSFLQNSPNNLGASSVLESMSGSR